MSRQARKDATIPPRLRILKYPWHTGHDYELAKLPHDFFYLTGTPRQWAVSQRPIPSNIRWVPDVDAVQTDLMILHLDQWSYHEPSKRFLYLRYRDSYPGTKVVINHGCNVLDGCSSAQMQELVGDTMMVCNSPLAKALWGVENSRYIRHGMSVEEWPTTHYGHHNVIVVQPYSTLHGTARNVEFVERANDRVPITWIGRDKRFNNFQKYKHYLQSCSIFLQPSFASANPRARTEAMLTGLAIVTTASHGEEEYIRNGVNGFASNDEDELIDYLEYLYARPDEVRRIGAAGRETAQRFFNIDQFIAQWNDLLDHVAA